MSLDLAMSIVKLSEEMWSAERERWATVIKLSWKRKPVSLHERRGMRTSSMMEGDLIITMKPSDTKRVQIEFACFEVTVPMRSCPESKEAADLIVATFLDSFFANIHTGWIDVEMQQQGRFHSFKTWQGADDNGAPSQSSARLTSLFRSLIYNYNHFKVR